MVSNYFLEINGVTKAEPVKPVVSEHFLRINGVSTSPPAYSPPPPPPPPAPVVQPPQNHYFGIPNDDNTGVRATSYSPPPAPASQPTPNQYFGIPNSQNTPTSVPVETPPAPAITTPPPTDAEIWRAEARIAQEILEGRDADRLHLINPATGREFTDAEIGDISERIDIYQADQRIAQEIAAGNDADRIHLINPRTGQEYTDSEIAAISDDVAEAEQQHADARIAREIIAGNDPDRLHLINPETGREYSDAEISEISGIIDDHNAQVQLTADARVARELLAGNDADRMHFINPRTGQEYTDAEIAEISQLLDMMDMREQAEADQRVANEIWAGRDADQLHIINPSTGQEYTDTEIAEITVVVREQQKDALTPEFDTAVDAMVNDGTSREVAERLTAFSYVQAGVPEAALPHGIETFDPGDVFRDDHEQFDVAREISDGETGRADDFVSLGDFDAIIENPDLFDPNVVATAMIMRAAADAEGNEDFRGQFEKQGWLEAIRESEWLNPNSDSLFVNLVRMNNGGLASPEFINRVVQDGPGELLQIGQSLDELHRFMNMPYDFVATTGEAIRSGDLGVYSDRFFERMEQTGQFWGGVADWTVDTVQLVGAAAILSNPATTAAFEDFTGIDLEAEVLFAAEGLARGLLSDPDQIMLDMVGYETFLENPVRWAGQQAPDIVIDIATGGIGASDNVIRASADAARLAPSPTGQQRLFDADEFLDVPGQQQLFDADDYLEVPDLVAPTRAPEIPGQLGLFDEPVPELPFPDTTGSASSATRPGTPAGDFFWSRMAENGFSPTDIPAHPHLESILPAGPGTPDYAPHRSGQLFENAITNELRVAGYDVIEVANRSGNGTDHIAMRPGDPSSALVIESKANTSRLNAGQQLGGEAHFDSVIDRLLQDTSSWNTDELNAFLGRNGMTLDEFQDSATYLIARDKAVNPDGAVVNGPAVEITDWTPGTTGTTRDPVTGDPSHRREWRDLFGELNDSPGS